MIRCITLLLSYVLLLAGAHAQMGGGRQPPPAPEFDGETLIYRSPEGWQPYSKTSEIKVETYLFPADQTPSDWQEAIHLERYVGTQGVTQSSQVFTLRTQGDRAECVERNVETLRQEPENGYSMTLWKDSCTLTDNSTLVMLNKVILGNEQLYSLSKAWKFEPNEGQMTRWLNFLNQAYLCDPDTGVNECALPTAGRGGRRR